MDRYLRTPLGERVSPQSQPSERWPIMKSQSLALYVLAAAIVGVGVMAFGVRASSLWGLAFVVACPLMMIFMMRSMHGGNGNDTGHSSRDDEHDARPGRR
jgi:hypothetical protein